MGMRTVINFCPGCDKKSVLVRIRTDKKESKVRVTEHPVHIDCLKAYVEEKQA